MKQLHKPNLWSWSLFNEERNLDFHSVFWSRPAGNVVIDPLPFSVHDAAHVVQLGGIRDIILTNSDHARATARLLEERLLEEGLLREVSLKSPLLGGAPIRVWGPRLEPAFLEAVGARPLATEHSLGADLQVLELQGSKTPGELCLVIEGDTLVTGDLIRGQRAGRLNLLPDAKLSDKALAIGSLEALARLRNIEAVLVGDGWPLFRAGSAALLELLREQRPE
jgi:glyoxylase-like metal-dependent hydrolase (beta-lactamase superfamily II)